MGRKNTLKCHKPQTPKVFSFDITVNNHDRLETIEIMATHIDSDMETLKAYIGDKLVGEFREWVYYIQVNDLYDDDRAAEITRQVNLPKDFGNVK